MAKKKVVIIGGGVAGMSAAHELMERGFEVEVYESKKHYPGGKARSVDVPGTNQPNPDKYLPGEHGFRFFPGFYKHLPDTMKRIPYNDSSGKKMNVTDNLVETNRMRIARYGKPSIETISNFPQSFKDLKFALHSIHADTGLTDEEKHHFALKLWQLMTSCWDRRANDYERLGWWEFTDADKFPPPSQYQTLLTEGITRTLVAANARYASTKTDGDIILQMIFNITNPLLHADRVLNGPTNERWLYPWLDYLRKSGVKYTFHQQAEKIEFDPATKLISGVWLRNKDDNSTYRVTGDYYILATPVEVAAELISDDMIKWDQTLNGIRELAPSTAWMTGIQFYLNEEVDVVHGHCMYVDTQWALTSISQLQFWKNYDIENRCNGKVKGILSVDVSNWTNEGFNRKKAENCTREEIKDEIWTQLKKSLNVDGKEVLRDDMIVDWYLDKDIHLVQPHLEANREPFLVNRVDTWCKRPEAYTNIDNFFLASDYVRTFTDLATMEAANEAARRAVNCILDRSGSDASECKVWNLHEPFWLAPLRWRDQRRYNRGLPYKFHEPWWWPILHWIMTTFLKPVLHRAPRKKS
jgi:uncharacterized protein with NAD-binding domain and iron-sulfur cluster